MLQSIKTRWRRTISGLLAVIMAAGMLPTAAFAAGTSDGGSNPYAPTGSFELHVAGTTAWNGGDSPLTIYKTENGTAQAATISTAVPFALLEDKGGDRLKVGYQNGGWTGSSLDGTGWVDKDSVLVNLPDVLPSIAYKSDGNRQFNSRLTRFEYVIPGSYALAEQLAQLQREAMSNGETLVIRQSGQTVSVSRAKGDPAQLHSYSLDEVTYQKYDRWTEYDVADDSLSDLSYELSFSVNRAYSADPSVTLTKFCPQTVKQAPARVSASSPTGGVGAYNPGSPGGKKPSTSNVSWSTDPERTFLRFTLLEFPQGVVTDLNTNDYSTWHVVGTPLNVVWSKGWSADECRSDITWYNSQAMSYNGMGANAAQLMAGSSVAQGVYSYDATLTSNGIFTTDSQGEIRISNLAPGAYVISEIKAPDNYVMDNPSTNVVIGPNGDTQTVIITNTPKATLTITKRDAVTRKPLANAEFIVRDSEGHAVGPTNGIYKTGTDGTVVVSGLEPGATIMVSETKAPTGYILDETPKHIVVKSGISNSLIFDNEPGTTLIIQKFIEGTENEPLSGVAFKVTDGSGAAVGPDDGVYYTDHAGEIVLSGIEPGTTVKAREIKTVEGYVLDGTPQDILIKGGEVQRLTFWNRKAGTLVLQKKDSVSGALIPGAQFQLTYANGGFVDNDNGHLSSNGLYTTDDKGEIRISGITGTVVAKEVKAAPGYVIDQSTQTQTVTVNPMDTQTLVFLNEPLCSLTLTKKDAVTGKPVPNTEFTLKDGDGNVLGRYTTGKDGTVTVTGLIPNSTVVVVETKVPSNYVLDPTPRTIIVRNGSNSVASGGAGNGGNVSGGGTGNSGSNSGNDMTVENIPKTTLTIEKYLQTDTGEQPLKGVTFLVTDSSGAVIGTNNGEYTSDENGRIVIPKLEPGITITAKEIRVPDGVVLDPTPKSIEIKGGEGGQTLRFVNQKAGNLIINKVDGIDKHPLAGVRFKITYADGSNVDQDGGKTSSNGIYTTDSNGQIRISGIVGTVVITEVETIPGYYIKEEHRTKTVQVNANDTQTVTVYNIPTQALVIQKFETGSKDKPLAGVEFLVTDSDGTVLGPNNGIYKTDVLGRITIKDLTPGTVITARETKTLDGYVLDSTPQSIEIKSGEVQTMTFYNAPIGGLELIKVSEADKTQRIKGVTFEIRKMDGALVETVTTGDRGRVHVSLDAGDYYCVEIEAAEGFKIDSTPHYFTIRDNETTTLTVTNAPFSGIILHKIDSVTGLGIYNVKFLVYDQNKNPIGEYSTDDQGYIYLDDLTVQGKGKLFIRELEAAPGYELDKQYKTVYVQPGKTIEVEWENTPITGQFQIYKYAAEYNEVTGTPAGAPLQGAVYEISEARSGKVVDYITTDARGVAASKPLPLGRYKIVETTAPAYWQVSGKTFDETLEYSGQIIKVSDYDKPSNLGVTITKRGNAEVLAGSQMRYDFTVANTSNVPLSEFYWHDRIPTDAARATIFTTGTYSARLNYRILYKTNYSGVYQVLASNLITSSSYSFSLNAIPMQAGEYVTDVYLDFGKVPVGFQSVANPTLTVTVSGTAANGYQLINRADVGGKYQGTWQTGQATWVTIVRKLTPTVVPKLPKTGY